MRQEFLHRNILPGQVLNAKMAVMFKRHLARYMNIQGIGVYEPCVDRCIWHNAGCRYCGAEPIPVLCFSTNVYERMEIRKTNDTEGVDASRERVMKTC